MKINESRKNFFINTNYSQKNRNPNKIIRKELHKNTKTCYQATNELIKVFKGELVTLDSGISLCQFQLSGKR